MNKLFKLIYVNLLSLFDINKIIIAREDGVKSSLEKRVILDGVEVFILYKYNDFFKEILYRYKGCYDEELKNAFLNNFLMKLSYKYRNRKIVCAPSYYKDDITRGFNHVKEIAN